jgi:hypothetical protein
MGAIGDEGEFSGFVRITPGWMGRLIAAPPPDGRPPPPDIRPPPPDIRPPPPPRCAKPAGTERLPTITAVSKNITRVFMEHLRDKPLSMLLLQKAFH